MTEKHNLRRTGIETQNGADKGTGAGASVTRNNTNTCADASRARVLLYGLPKETPADSAAREILAALGVAATEVAPYQLLQQVGVLAGYEGEEAQLYFGRAPQEPVLVMAGFSSAQLDGLLAALRRAGIVIPLKAVLTEHNRSWSLLALIEELQREHAAMYR